MNPDYEFWGEGEFQIFSQRFADFGVQDFGDRAISTGADFRENDREHLILPVPPDDVTFPNRAGNDRGELFTKSCAPTLPLDFTRIKKNQNEWLARALRSPALER